MGDREEHRWTATGLLRHALLAVTLLAAPGAIAQALLATPDLALMSVSGGPVKAIAVQADGNIVIGGDFSMVNGVPRSRIARVHPDGTLDMGWNPGANNVVSNLAVTGGTVYASGSFTNIGGQPRNGVAALDSTTGLATAWITGSAGSVGAIALSGETVYAVGRFSDPGGLTNAGIAALSVVTGRASWITSTGGYGGAYALAVAAGTVYVGGSFETIGGQQRLYIAALDAATGVTTGWDPNAGCAGTGLCVLGFVNAVAVSGNTVYVGGQFTYIGGQPRNRVAALSTATGLATQWNPNASGVVNAFAFADSMVYVAGWFGSIGGQTRQGVAVVDAASGLASGWDPGAQAALSALAVSGATVYAGGGMTVDGMQLGFARFDATTAQHAAGARTFTGHAGQVTALARQDDGRVVVGGAFSWVGSAGVARTGLLRLNSDGTLDAAWNPDVRGVPLTLVVAANTLYMGGEFTSIGGVARNNVAALDLGTGLATDWNPNANAPVRKLVLGNDLVYAGGDFTSIGAGTRNYLAALDLATGVATSWHPSMNAGVHALVLSANRVYAGGVFTTVGGVTRRRLAAIDASTGALSTWNPDPTSAVSALAVSGNRLYAGGSFTGIGGQARNRLAAVDTGSGLATSWNPNANASVFALAVSRGTVYAAGHFNSLGGLPHNKFAALDAATGLSTWSPQTDQPLGSGDVLLVSGSRLYVGGQFDSIRGQRREGLAAFVDGTLIPADLNGDGRSDVVWRNGASGENYLYPMNGTAILGSEGYLRTVADGNWRIAGIGDFNGDGRADILWRNAASGENYLYLMDATAIAAEGYLRTVVDQNWQVAGVADFDGDGRADILWRNAGTGENYLYPMDGLTIKPGEGYLRTVADGNWRIAGVGDFDGDGKSDILWRNYATGENYLYPMSGTAIVGTEGHIRAVADANWNIVGIGDFNGDGHADILWRNAATGENYLYPMDGLAILGTEGYLRTVADQGWQVKGTGDYDGDGKADVLWRHAVSGENYVYFMDGTTIKPTEGYLRSVPQPDWRVQNPK